MIEKKDQFELLLAERPILYWTLAILILEWPIVLGIGANADAYLGYFATIEQFPGALGRLTIKAVGATALLSAGLILLSIFVGLAQGKQSDAKRSLRISLALYLAYSFATYFLLDKVFGYLYNWLNKEHAYLAVSSIVLVCVIAFRHTQKYAPLDSDSTRGKWLLAAIVILPVSGCVIAPLQQESHEKNFRWSLLNYLEKHNDEALARVTDQIRAAQGDNITLSSSEFFYIAVRDMGLMGCMPHAYLAYQQIANKQVNAYMLNSLRLKAEHQAALLKETVAYPENPGDCFDKNRIEALRTAASLEQIVCSRRLMACRD